MTEATQAPYVSRALDIVGAEAVRDPHGYFGALRNESPIIWDERSRSWVITSHALVTLALRDDRRFSSDRIRPFIARKLSSPDTDPGVRQAFDVLADWLANEINGRKELFSSPLVLDLDALREWQPKEPPPPPGEPGEPDEPPPFSGRS